MSTSQNAIFYTAALLEYTARKTQNTRAYIATQIGLAGIKEIFDFADVSHCLSFEETSDELIEKYHVAQGDFAPEKEVASPPDFLSIGQNYANIVTDCESEPEQYPDVLLSVLCSKISTWMTLYDNAFFYSPRDYQAMEYKALALNE